MSMPASRPHLICTGSDASSFERSMLLRNGIGSRPTVSLSSDNAQSLMFTTIPSDDAQSLMTAYPLFPSWVPNPFFPALFWPERDQTQFVWRREHSTFLISRFLMSRWVVTEERWRSTLRGSTLVTMPCHISYLNRNYGQLQGQYTTTVCNRAWTWKGYVVNPKQCFNFSFRRLRISLIRTTWFAGLSLKRGKVTVRPDSLYDQRQFISIISSCFLLISIHSMPNHLIIYLSFVSFSS